MVVVKSVCDNSLKHSKNFFLLEYQKMVLFIFSYSVTNSSVEWGLFGALMNVKYLDYYLAHSKPSVNLSYYYLLWG